MGPLISDGAAVDSEIDHILVNTTRGLLGGGYFGFITAHDGSRMRGNNLKGWPPNIDRPESGWRHRQISMVQRYTWGSSRPLCFESPRESTLNVGGRKGPYQWDPGRKCENPETALHELLHFVLFWNHCGAIARSLGPSLQ